MEKKRYEELELKTVRFDAEDVITTSADATVGDACLANCDTDYR
jgi:hypothetical protein